MVSELDEPKASPKLSPVVAHRLLSPFRDVASHGGQPFGGIVALFLLSVLGQVRDLGFPRSVFHPLLKEGGANQICGQVLQGSLMDPSFQSYRSTILM